jgi:HlyD family secretion protein
MDRFYSFFIFFVLSVIFFSCNSKKNNEIITFQASRTDFSNIITVYGSVEAIHSNFIKCPQLYGSTIATLTKDGTMVKAGDTVCILGNKELINNYERIKITQEQRRAELNKSKANLALKFALLEAEVKNNEAQTAISNLDSLQLKYASEVQKKITALELKRAAIQKKRFENKLAALEKINESELRKLELQIKRDDNQLTSIESKMKQLVILSPQDGLFMRSGSMIGWRGGKVKEGDKIYPGMSIAEIPDLSAMRIQFQTTESEYKSCSIGDSVVMNFDAMPGIFAFGKVTYRAPIGKPKTENSKVKYFDMIASIDSCKVLPGAGLSANCRIYVKNLTDTLVVPLISVFDEDSLKFMFVKNGNHFEKHEVIVGENSLSNAIILAGVAEGEVLALSKPNEKKVKKTILLPDDEKERVKKLQFSQKTKKPPQVNGEPPRSGSDGSSRMIIYF